MNGATVGLAAALGLQLSNLLWDATFAVLCLIGALLLCALVFEAVAIWDMLRKPVTHIVFGALPDDGGALSEDELTWAACKWCHDPACIDSTLCSCKVPCGRMLCKSETVTRG